MAVPDPNIPHFNEEDIDIDILDMELDDDEFIPNDENIQKLKEKVLALKKEMYVKMFEEEVMKHEIGPSVISYCLRERNRTLLSDAEGSDLNSSSSSSSSSARVRGIAQQGHQEEPQGLQMPEALRNTIVLDTIGRYLPIPTLRNLRLVNKEWNETFYNQIKRRKPLMITNPECPAANSMIYRKAAGDDVHISTLVVINTSLTSPVVMKIASLFGSNISGLVVDDCGQTGSLLVGLMRQMKSLEYIDMKLSSSDPLSTNVSDSMLDHVINLAPLNFKHVKVLNWEDVRAIKGLIYLPRYFPMLRSLKILFSDYGGNGIYKYGANQWQFLTQLEIIAPSKGGISTIMSAFSKTKPNLRKLKISNIGKNQRDLKSISSFLNATAHNLQSIELCKKTTIFNAPIPLNTRMFTVPFLKLETVRYDWSLSDMIRLAQELAPNLTTIDAANCSSKCWFDFFCGVTRGIVSDQPNLKVVSLHLGYVEPVCLRKLSTIFPRLTLLDVPRTEICKEALRIIFQNFICLRNLRIRKSNEEDNVLTTYGHEELQDSVMLGIKGSMLQGLQVNDDCIWETLEEYRTHPGIESLKELESFIIEAQGFYDPSDFFLRYAVQHLPKLTTLKFPLLLDDGTTEESKVAQIKKIHSPTVKIETTSPKEKYIKLDWSNPLRQDSNSDYLKDIIKKMSN